MAVSVGAADGDVGTKVNLPNRVRESTSKIADAGSEKNGWPFPFLGAAGFLVSLQVWGARM